MNRMKRGSSSNSSSNVETKQLRRKSISCIEDFSNEIFYEIFDYLDIFDIYETFSNLNNRFQHLITDSSYLLRIKLSSKTETLLEYRCKNIIIPNIHRIISLHLWDTSLIETFFEYCIIDSSFSSLQSIALHGISGHKLLILLFYLNSLPSLFSLSIYSDYHFGNDLGHIYRMIFHSPSLEYLKLSFPHVTEIDFSVLATLNRQFSTLKYLIIDHSCTFNGLISILCHTPQLCHLTCQRLVELGNSINNEFSMKLSNLTYISIHYCDVTFSNFEMFIKNISSHLKTLRININSDQNYLDASRWKQLIANHMPNLHKIDLKYTGNVHKWFNDINFETSIIQFTSAFWIERGWCLEVEINHFQTIYWIHSSKRRWFQIQDYTNAITSSQKKDDTFSVPFSSNVPLIVKNNSYSEWDQSFINKIKSIFPTIKLTSLHLDWKNISIHMFMKILRVLPHLDSLEVSSFQLTNLSNEDAKLRSLISTNNKITKINLEQMINVKHVDFLLTLCPCIQHLRVGCEYDNRLMNVVRSILLKNTTQNPYFCSLCLYIPGINKTMTHPIQSMIAYEKLLTNYVVRHVPNNIILQWK